MVVCYGFSTGFPTEELKSDDRDRPGPPRIQHICLRVFVGDLGQPGSVILAWQGVSVIYDIAGRAPLKISLTESPLRSGRVYSSVGQSKAGGAVERCVVLYSSASVG